MRGFDLIANIVDKVLPASRNSTHGTPVLHWDFSKDEVEDLIGDFVGLLDLYRNRVGWIGVAVLGAVDKGNGVLGCVLTEEKLSSREMRKHS
jgi:hypothetical protein